MNCECTIPTIPGRLRHHPRERLHRHRHDCGFVAVILSGSYLEAGDRGRMRVAPGEVIVHGAFESHFNDVAPTGAEVLVLPWRHDITSPLARISDPDELARVAERDVDDAAALIANQLIWRQIEAIDWPDQLAQDIRRDPHLNLEDWALRTGLRQETISRGFRRAYGTTAAAFRARIRVLKALAGIEANQPLAQVAADCGFADQAHLTRNFRQLTGHTPGVWRRAG